MAVLDAPPHHELGTVERGRASIRAQKFLDVLQGAFQLTWERPEELRQAMSELSTSEEAKIGLRVLWEYLEALSPSLLSMYGVEAREGEGEGGAARQAKDGRKRRKRKSRSNTSGGGVGDVSEVGGCASSSLWAGQVYTFRSFEARLELAGRQCAIPTLLGACAEDYLNHASFLQTLITGHWARGGDGK
jgi:hypothetical protein